MSRSNYDKPFYVDMGKDIASIRCASNGDVIDSLDHNGSEHAIKIIERTCERMNREFELYAKLKASSVQPTCDWSVKDALNFANTLSNHGWTRDANADTAATCIYALCRMLREVGNAAAMREMLIAIKDINDMRPHDGMGYEIDDIIREALSAPPRNCDRFNNEREMQFAFLAELLSRGRNSASLEEYSKWLLAEAKGADNEK